MEIRFCDRCHESIPDADFDAGRAVTLGSKNLHVACALRRTASLAGPRSWLAFLLALLAAVGVTYLLVRDGWQGTGRGVSAAVQKRIDDGVETAVARSTSRIAATAKTAQETDAQILAQIGDLRNEVRLVKDGLEERIARAGAAASEQVAPLRKSVDDLAREVTVIQAWIKEVAERAKERATPAPSPEPPGPAPTPDGTPTAPKPTPTPPAPSPNPPAEEDPNHAALVDMWIKRLKDPNNGIVFSATLELGRLKDLRAVPPLIETLEHKDFYVRLGCATALGELGAVDAMPALIDGLNDKDDLVRTAVDDALKQIAAPLLTDKDREELQFQASMGAGDRRRVQSRWRAWWKANEAALRKERAQPPA